MPARSTGLAAGRLGGRNRIVLAAIPLDSIRVNPQQPRHFVDPERLEELAASVRARGILQPIVVRRDGKGFMIMAGERRYRAAKRVGLATIPAVVRDDDPGEIALIENLQREDLTALEEAEALAAMVARYGYTHQALADVLHKSRPYVSNMLVLSRLPAAIKAEIHRHPAVSREILMSIVRAGSEPEMIQLWQRVKLANLSVQRFRATQRADGERAVVREIVGAARRLNRTLGSLEGSGLGEAERRSLGRLLRKTRKRVETALAAL